MKRALLVFIVASCFSILPLGQAPFSSHGEAREALVVRNMFDQSNFILPLRNGVDIPSKPPLFHWLAALTSTLSGQVNEFATRFPSALSAVLLLSLLYLFLAQYAQPAVALLTILLLATSFEWARSATLARVDMLFALCLNASIAFFYHSLERWRKNGSISFVTLLLLAVSFLGAVLTKGPTGILIPLIFFAFIWGVDIIRGEKWGKRFVVSLLYAAMSALACSAVWYFLAYLNGGWDFIQVHLLKENAARAFALDGYEIGHEKPIYYSLIYFLMAFLPWSLLFPLVISWLWTNRQKVMQDDLLRYALSWVGLFLVIVTVASSKRSAYYLPAMPALSFLCAVSLAESKIRKRVIQAAILLLAVFFIGHAFIYPSLAEKKSPRDFIGEVKQHVLGDVPIYQYRENNYPAMFYAGRNLPFVGNPSEFKDKAPCFVIAKSSLVEELRGHAEVMFESKNLAFEGKDRLVLLRCL